MIKHEGSIIQLNNGNANDEADRMLKLHPSFQL